jgi:hypothetical protein
VYKINFIERLPSFFRWILIPLVSVLGYLLVSLIVNIAGLIMTFISVDRGGFGINFWTYLISPGLSGYFAVYSSAIIAPSGKRVTAIIMGGTWFMLAGIFAYTSIIIGQWSNLIAVVSTVVGCGFALVHVQTELMHHETIIS